MILDRIRKRIDYARFYTLYEQSIPTIDTWQAASLQRLIHYAEKNVPMWNAILKSQGIHADAIRSTRDLRLLPIIGKNDFLGKPSDEYTDNSRRILTRESTTSGSTGKPFEFFPSNKYFDPLYSHFCTFRFLAHKRRSLQSLSKMRNVRIRVTSNTIPNRLYIGISEFLQDTGAALTKIRDFKPEAIYAPPSLLLKLAQAVGKNPDDAISVPYVISTAEMLQMSVRAFIEATLGCEVYDSYGTEEVGTIAVECERHDGQHLLPESAIVEIVDMNGDSIPEDQEGRVIVTDLLNYNMPFIRYDTGDRGVMTTVRCKCGLYTPRIWIKGRYAGFLQFYERTIHRMQFETKMNCYMSSVLQYQVVKRTPDELLMRIIPVPGFNMTTEEHIKRDMRELTGERVNINVELVSSITPMPSGKSQTTVDESIQA